MSNTFKYIFYVTLPFVCGLAFAMESDKKLKKKANKALITAVKKGDKTAIMKALTDGADANSFHKNLFNRPQQLLQSIIWQKDRDLLAFCLKKGANPNAKNKFGETVLHKAAQYALSFSIPLLLQQCDNVNIQDNEGKTPLHLVLAESDALLLLQAGANPNIYDTQGFTPVQLAATKAWTHFVRALINYIPMQDIIQEQRKAAILLLNCFKKLQKKIRLQLPKDIQRLLCDYAIPGIADVDALVDKKINWLRNHFAQTVNGKTLAQICGESQNDNENAAYLMDDPQPAIGLEEFTQFKQLIDIEKLDQHRPVIRKNIIELLQDIPLWHKRNTSEIAKRYTASTM